LANAIFKTSKAAITVMQVQSEKAEIFHVGKRNIKNQKMTDSWGNDKTACSVLRLYIIGYFWMRFTPFEN